MGKQANIRGEIAAQATRQGQAGATLSALLEEAPTLQSEQAYMGNLQGLMTQQLDLGQVTKRWEETFAQPAMEAWWKYNAPGVRDEYAGVPGAFYSGDRARGVVDSSNAYSGQIAQTLYGSLENAAARTPQMLQMLQQMSPSGVYGNYISPQINLAGGIAAIGPYQQYEDVEGDRRRRMQGAGWGMIGGAIGTYLGGPQGGEMGSQLGGALGSQGQQ